MKSLLSVVALFWCATFSAQYVVEFNLVTDDYPQETSWEITDANGDPVIEGDNYSTSGEQDLESVDLPEGEYTFTIYDEYGDGICCGFGDGSFALYDVSTDSYIAQGGSFDDEYSVDFAQPYVAPVGGCMDPEAVNYNPNAEVDDGSCIYETSQLVIDLEEIADGFDSPVDISHAGDDRLFIVEQDGYIRILNPDGTTESDPFLDIDGQVASGGERGLLGLAFHPNYAENGYFFVNYTKNGGDSRISRFTVTEDPNIADVDSELIILEQEQPYSNHNAGDLAFGADGYLYIPFGDGGSGEDPLNAGQSTDTWLGKMLRIDIDGEEPYTVPDSNPFIDNDDYLPEIWAIGLRNTWRISFDAETGDLWMGDVGQYDWEEIDLELAGDAGGRNYGWRCYEGTHAFNTNGCVDESELTWPVTEYNHSGGACSVTGGYVYRGESFATMYGKYFYVDYCNGLFRALEADGEDWIVHEVTNSLGFGWTSFGENSAEELFVCNSDGTIYQLVDPCGEAEASFTYENGLLTASEGAAYAWFLNGELVEGETEQTWNPQMNGNYSVAILTEEGCSVFSEEMIIDGVVEIARTFDVSVYPNPVRDELTIDFKGDLMTKNINILDMQGRVVFTMQSNQQQVRIDMSALSAGQYVVQLSNDAEVEHIPFIRE